MPRSMKQPTICEAPGARSGWIPGPFDTATGDGARPVHAYAYGRLRPRFVDQGAWHELWCLLHDDPARHTGDDGLDRVLAKAFERRPDGELPEGFYIARELVWPLEDVLGVAQCVVVPASDEEILELLEALCAAPARCKPTAQAIVRGTLAGYAHELPGRLRGLPRVALVSAFSYDPPQGIGAGPDEERERLFRSYRPLLANNGLGDELRAINYVLTQSAAFYELASRLDKRTCEHHHEQRLVGMQAVPVEGTAHAPQMEVVFTFQGIEGSVRRWFQRVDVQGPFMFFTTEDVQPFYVRSPGVIRPQGGAVWHAAVGSPPVDDLGEPPPADAPPLAQQPAQEHAELPPLAASGDGEAMALAPA
jgi:hypothetical protein